MSGWKDYTYQYPQGTFPEGAQPVAIAPAIGRLLKNFLLPYGLAEFAQNPTNEGWQNIQKQAFADLPNAAAGMGTPVAKLTPGMFSTAVDSAVMRKKLAQQVPEYSQVVESMGGIRKNVGEMAGEVWDKLKGWAQPQGELAYAPAQAAESATAYRPFMQRALGKHGVVIPYIPKSTQESLVLKTPESNIAGLTEALGLNPSLSLGQYVSLWGRNHVGNTSRIDLPSRRLAGDVLLSTLENQETIIPHETGHWLQNLITKIYNRYQPEIASIAAQRQVGSPELYEQASRKVWDAASPGILDRLEKDWPQESGQRLINELIAEMTTPQALAARLSIPVEKAGTMINQVRRIPVLQKFYDEVPNMINKDAYRVPFVPSEGWQQASRSGATELWRNWSLD